MSWTEAEAALARALRREDPPVRYADIARCLGGGRSAEAVRQKLISDRVAAARGGRRGRMDWVAGHIDGPCLGDRDFQRALMAGGGHSRFSEVVRNPGTSAAYRALVMPLIGPDGRPRPCAASHCQCVASRSERACETAPAHLKETTHA
jgi:hypothetical protein